MKNSTLVEQSRMFIQSMSRWCPTQADSGRHSAKQTNREKTIQFGYKNFWLTTKTGFPVHCIPYAGKKGICEQSGKDLTARVVLQLVLTGGISDKDFLFFDNWYAGYKILTILTALGIRTTGTIRTDRLKFLPSQFEGAQEKERVKAKNKSQKKSKNKKAVETPGVFDMKTKKPEPVPLIDTAKLKSSQRGLSVVKYDTFSGMAVVGWNDNNVVNVVSNSFTPESNHQVQRYSQKNKQKILIDRPESIPVYNAGMGGVEWTCLMEKLQYIELRSEGRSGIGHTSLIHWTA